MLKRTPRSSASSRSSRSSSTKRRREEVDPDLAAKFGEEFGLRDGPYTIQCTNEIGSSWKANSRGQIVLGKKRNSQWNLYIHELDTSAAVASPSRLPGDTMCIVMLELADRAGSFITCDPSEGTVSLTDDERLLASTSSKFWLRERVWSDECQDTYVISPVGYPKVFLRHSNWKIRCDTAGVGAEFKGDATFRCVLVSPTEELTEIDGFSVKPMLVVVAGKRDTLDRSRLLLTKKLTKLVSRRESCKKQLVVWKNKFEKAKELVQSLKKDIRSTERELEEAKKRKLDESTSTTASTVL